MLVLQLLLQQSVLVSHDPASGLHETDAELATALVADNVRITGVM